MLNIRPPSTRPTDTFRMHCAPSEPPAHTHQSNPSQPPALLPEPKGALLGDIPADSPQWSKVAGEAARTIPGRENGGNCDIKNLSRGCKVGLWGICAADIPQWIGT